MNGSRASKLDKDTGAAKTRGLRLEELNAPSSDGGKDEANRLAGNRALGIRVFKGLPEHGFLDFPHGVSGQGLDPVEFAWMLEPRDRVLQG